MGQKTRARSQTKKRARCAKHRALSYSGVLLSAQGDRRRSLRPHIVYEQRDEIAALQPRDDFFEIGGRLYLALLWIQHADDDRAVLIELVVRWPTRRDIRDEQEIGRASCRERV